MPGIIIAITGASGSGKSTLSQSLCGLFDDTAVCLSTDFYYKGREPETLIEDYLKRNFDHPDALLLDRFAHDVGTLLEGNNIRRPQMDFSGGTFIRTDDAVEVEAKPVIILEGIFCLHHPKIRELVKEHGYSIYTHAPSAVVLKRVALRDATDRHLPYEHTLKTYTGNVFRGYFDFIKPLKTTCNLYLPTWNREENDVSIEKLTQTAVEGFLPRLPTPLMATLLLSSSISITLRDMLEEQRIKNESQCTLEAV